jgi:hypothetical protein
MRNPIKLITFNTVHAFVYFFTAIAYFGALVSHWLWEGISYFIQFIHTQMHLLLLHRLWFMIKVLELITLIFIY